MIEHTMLVWRVEMSRKRLSFVALLELGPLVASYLHYFVYAKMDLEFLVENHGDLQDLAEKYQAGGSMHKFHAKP
jgi:hypothetical protein